MLVDRKEEDEEISLQVIEPVDVPDSLPPDLVPAEGRWTRRRPRTTRTTPRSSETE